jgi:hypothetical protein
MSKRNTPIGSVALFLILGLCPIHADNHPYGIMPKIQHVHVASAADLDTWHLRCSSLSEFIDTVRQPSFETLGSGETDVAYYVLFRADQDLLIFAYSFKKEEKKHTGFELSGRAGSEPMVDASSRLKIVDLLETTVETSGSATGIENEWVCRVLFGFTAKIKPGYAGPLTLRFLSWADEDKGRSVASPTINWTSNP